MSFLKTNRFLLHFLRNTLMLWLILVPSKMPASEFTWVNKGPDGGAIQCMEIDPLDSGTLYVGTGGGGIFKSVDNGKHWFGSSAGLTDFNITAMVINPKESGTIYCGTQNAGVFRSNDGGRSWTGANSGLPGLNVTILLIDPISTDTLYAGTAGAGVFKSTDGGRHWTATNTGLTGPSFPNGEWVSTMAIDRMNPAVVYAGTSHDGVFKSNNGGQTWAAASTGFSNFSLFALAIDPHDTGVLYAGVYVGGVSEVWKTLNGGERWNPVAGVGLSPFNVVARIIVDSRQTVYAIGYLSSTQEKTGIFKSHDGGGTWTALSEVPDGQIPPLAIDPQDPSVIYAGSNNSGVYKSDDGGHTWIRNSHGISAIGISSLTIDRTDTKTIYAGTSQGVFKSTDSGQTWARKLSHRTDVPVVIDPSDPDIIYVVSEDVLKSTDGGDSWRTVDQVHGILALAMDPNHPKTLYGGEGYSPFGHFIQMDGVSRTDDGGETWRPANGGLPTSRYLFKYVAVDPKDPATVYAATLFSSGWQSHVYKSTDGGTGWRRIWDEPKIMTLTLDPQNTKVLYAGTDADGFFKSTDGGESWFSIDNTLKNKLITALAVNETTAAVYAGTAEGNEGKVFRSADGGNTWTELHGESPLPRIYVLTIDPHNSDILYAGTSGGVYKLGPFTSAWALEVPAGGATTRLTEENEASVQSGYATITLHSGAMPSGVAVYRFKQNEVTVSEVGVTASAPTTSTRMFIDYHPLSSATPERMDADSLGINTGIAMVNRNPLSANLVYTLRNVDGGTLAVGHGHLAAGCHWAVFIDQLQEIAPDFALPADFRRAPQQASLEITSDQPVSILALRMTTNQRQEVLFTTTPTADLTQSLTGTTLYFPQFADGGGYNTSLILLNTSSARETGVLQFLDDYGAPLLVTRVGGTTGNTFRYSVPAGGYLFFQTDGSATEVKTGWVRLMPDPGTYAPIGSGVFSYTTRNIRITESGFSAAVATTHARIYVDLSGNHNTGLALANVTEANAAITIQAYQSDGSTGIGSSKGPLLLTGNGHGAKFADEFVAGLPYEFSGVFDISSPTPFSAFTLRSLYNERHDFLLSTIPVAKFDQTTSDSAVFPQIVDGGGYLTQFIFLSSGVASTARLKLYSEYGIPLAIGRD